jgi:hypothetical protein
MNAYLVMLQLYALPRFKHLQLHIFLQQDGTPPHWVFPLRTHLDEKFLGRWKCKESLLIP